MEKPGRVHALDSLRGLAVLVMIAYHFLYDLYFYAGLSPSVLYNPVMDTIQVVFAGIFICLSGIAARYSRSNLRRGVRLLGIALALSLVTWLMGNPIWFGVLHFLSVSMILYGLVERLLNRMGQGVAPVVYLAALLLSSQISRLNPVEVSWLFPLGLRTATFYSADYFPLLPWLFVFLLGTWAGGLLRQGRGPKLIYNRAPGPLAKVGRHSLVIYILHQPILYGITLLIVHLI